MGCCGANRQSIGRHLVDKPNENGCGGTHCFVLQMMCPIAQDAQLPHDDETRRLLAAFEACRAEELAAAD